MGTTIATAASWAPRSATTASSATTGTPPAPPPHHRSELGDQRHRREELGDHQTTERVLAEFKQVKLTTPKKKDLLVDRLGEILAEQNVEPAIVKRVKNLVKSDSDIAEYVAK